MYWNLHSVVNLLSVKCLFVIDSGSNLVNAFNYLIITSFFPIGTTGVLKSEFDGSITFFQTGTTGVLKHQFGGSIKPLSVKYLLVIDSGSNLVNAFNYLKSMQNLIIPSFFPTGTTGVWKHQFDGSINPLSNTCIYLFVIDSWSKLIHKTFNFLKLFKAFSPEIDAKSEYSFFLHY